MKTLKNRKGFTLIEMLVVIAIIAVLTSIIIPVVGNSTEKAAAATNAANLRSVQGELATMYLAEPNRVSSNMYKGANELLTMDDESNVPAPAAQKCAEVEKGTEMWVLVGTDGTVKAFYEEYDVEYFAYIAENGEPNPNYVADSRAEIVNGLNKATEFLSSIANNNTLAPIANALIPTLTNNQYKDINDMITQANGYISDAAAGMDTEDAAGMVETITKIENAIDKTCGCTNYERKGGWSWDASNCKNCTHGLVSHLTGTCLSEK